MLNFVEQYSFQIETYFFPLHYPNFDFIEQPVKKGGRNQWEGK
jgi:hypothetical protein